jgi:alpha-amylase/alpha-mannosidase (GH57 family)
LLNLCIHGHFYQPPRENPWTGEVEKQDSATPYHDWNEKIFAECYKPNTEAELREFSDALELENNPASSKVFKFNNFEYLSFNFGPTLFTWIKNKHPDTYDKILSADTISVAKHSGHGNAIAMCYNHMIMPLANLYDKVTQVKWGLEDFRYHFKRESEGIWLPETACNMETIEVLIQEGVKFIILDPGQADSLRESADGPWQDVSNGSINPFISYKCYSEKIKDKYINIFFYDGPISKSISFDDTLYSPSEFLEKITGAASQAGNSHKILSIATDGETFGHHKRYTEKSLALLFAKLAPENNLNIMNFGEYLAEFPSVFEVKIKSGDNDEGTSWSCPHGVKRWQDDCGCGGGAGWNQSWRSPLRESLNWLRDELIEVFQSVGKDYFKDVWTARNEYIKLMVDNSPGSVMNYFNENAKKILSKDEIILCYLLLEMQKYAMFMFTSCGWFFSEISGLETVKILEYAARAIQIAEELTGKSYEMEFIAKLSEAKSNIQEVWDGRGVWEKLVKPMSRAAL